MDSAFFSASTSASNPTGIVSVASRDAIHGPEVGLCELLISRYLRSKSMYGEPPSGPRTLRSAS